MGRRSLGAGVSSPRPRPTPVRSFCLADRGQICVPSVRPSRKLNDINVRYSLVRGVTR